MLPLFKSHGTHKMAHAEQHLMSGYTFTDLAQLVCKVPGTREDESSSSSSSEDEDYEGHGYASEPSVSTLHVCIYFMDVKYVF
ncbi:neuropathy target esterase sws-like [Agrilus planipennis]|uniref:Neuropathy target esterase sws-like n=1 Tax=Agrilus planipennis TaxID=224129 RepID=A0A7F5RHB4_AGRPL|nr:neuropathy target esterase sws-like [Agrilus planipennis]